MRALGSGFLLASILISGCAQVGGESGKIDQAVKYRVELTREAKPSKQTYLACRDEVEQALRRELAFFYPACVDKEQGGFTHALPADWA